jgi:hypothetical protein
MVGMDLPLDVECAAFCMGTLIVCIDTVAKFNTSTTETPLTTPCIVYLALTNPLPFWGVFANSMWN